MFGEVSSSVGQMAKRESKGLILVGRNGDSSLFPVNGGVYCFQPGMSKDGVFLSSIDDIELNPLGDISKANDIRGLVSVLNRKGPFEAICGDMVSVDKIPVNAIHLGS